MKRKDYEVLYMLDADLVPEDFDENIVMCGDNWDFYCTKNLKEALIEKLENVSIITNDLKFKEHSVLAIDFNRDTKEILIETKLLANE